MKQIVQSPRTGRLELAEVPAPALEAGQVLVRNHFSVMSPGTEKLAVDFARRSLLGKARSRPDLVKQVARKLRQEGPLPTYRAVMSRLDAPQPLGYSCAGVVEAVGEGVVRFSPGDRVACAGAGYANHAEWVAVPDNLCAAVPEGLPLEKAAWATLGAIALQGLRVAAPVLGEVAAVIGLGAIGQLCVQLLRANGCRVLAIDLDERRVGEARASGAEWGAVPGADHGGWIDRYTDGHGVDLAVVAAGSDSSAPVQLAAELCRLKGRVISVGATGLELDRRQFFGKELELRMSMSTGPGRYDRRYEEGGVDYPLPYVRWTENRNLEAFLSLVAAGSADPERLAAEIVDLAEATAAYDALASGGRRGLAVVFRYPEGGKAERTQQLAPRRDPVAGEVGVAFLGAGNYAKGVLLPALERCKHVARRSVVTASGPSAKRTAERFGFADCGTDPEAVLEDPGVSLVFVATRHDTHAALAARALRAGKAVWLEKPAAIDAAGLDELERAARETGGFLTVGFNRRFSSHARAVRDAFAGRSGPLALHYTVAAGPTPGGTWIADPAVGGGRIVGEVCHFVDLASFLVGAAPNRVYARALARDPESDDSTVALLEYADGSTATIAYLARANSELPKERFEASADGRTARCDNYRVTEVVGGAKHRTPNQDKGQQAAVEAVVEAVRAGAAAPIPLDEILAVSRATLAIRTSAERGEAVEVPA